MLNSNIKSYMLKHEIIDGSIILKRIPNKIRSFRDLLGKAIGFITNGKHCHSVVYINGYIRESTIGGVKETFYNPWDYLNSDHEYDLLIPKKPIEKRRVELMDYNSSKLVKEKKHYNYLKLFSLALVYPTRWFWNLIDYVPFQNNIFGVVCSVFIDKEVYKYAGIDLIKKENEEYTAPSDLICDFFDYYE